MITIYEYTIDIINDIVVIPMPRDSKILKVGQQDGVIRVWAEVLTTNPDVDVKIHIRGTGNPQPYDRMIYIDSVFIDPFVWHIYTDPKNLYNPYK